ncbi:hypothetical protein MMC30_007840 [Trapelia coarctata]|nr:hypothetical protein [Trapelia coarctata]
MPSRRLSAENLPRDRSPVDRIIEHERALTPSPKSFPRGPGFRVVSRTKNPGPGTLNLADFPNEVLTHIFSHLPPLSLSAVSTVSHRVHSLVTTPHAWRIAFSRYFPGSDALAVSDTTTARLHDEQGSTVSERRVFTRLTTLASWRSEYILRTRLLRSLARGKPALSQGLGASGSSRSGPGHSGNAQITYSSNLFTTVNHLHASYGTEPNKKLPRFIHAADEIGAASSSDPNNSRVDRWGFSDPISFLQFAERFPGDTQYGLGPGDVVGLPNSMDVSQQYGMVHAEGSPGGLVYFRSTEEQRGRLLAHSLSYSSPDVGIPRLNATSETMCSIWIAKSPAVPTVTGGLIGIVTGTSYGIITSYSLGTNSVAERRLERGEITARWVLSPGVPIIGIAVDGNLSSKRLRQHRVWAVALNALGEVFYLTSLPARRVIERSTRLDEQELDELAWETGRTVGWFLLEPTRRQAKSDPFDRSDADGSYSPRSSWNGMGLEKNQIIAETKEIESFLKGKPRHFRKICHGWDMRRRLDVDFAGDCGNEDGEAIVVSGCGLDEQPAEMKRFTRCRIEQGAEGAVKTKSFPSSHSLATAVRTSLFGREAFPTSESPAWSFNCVPVPRRSPTPEDDLKSSDRVVDEWRVSEFSFGSLKAPGITTTSIDDSTFALLTASEDPLLSLSGSSATSSPLASPLGQTVPTGSVNGIPGQRARFIAAGTKLGNILVWNLRAPVSGNTEITNMIYPVRVIHTDSPQISCLAISALYLVHGGNDGLVQAWDPLASTTQPIRTLNSRFSSRARRRLVQAEASVQGVGVTLFTAGAVCLDPDPTVLRGMVSLGTHLRYWSYSSSAADQYKGNKRRTRRSERGSNQGPDKFSGTSRGALQDYIANERADLEREKQARRKEEERLAGRFGLDLLGPGASEDEILAYATLLSEEAAKSDETRRKSESEGSVISRTEGPPVESQFEDETDPDIAEAIKLSLQEAAGIPTSLPDTSQFRDFPMRYAKKRSPSSSPPRSAAAAGSSLKPEADDLEFVLQLSLAEEASRREVVEEEEEEEFPMLSKSPSPPIERKGKGKRRDS